MLVIGKEDTYTEVKMNNNKEYVEQYVNLDFGSDYVQMCYPNFDIDDICNAIYCYEDIEEVRASIKNTYNIDVCIDNGEYIEYDEEELKRLISFYSYFLLNCCPKAIAKIEQQYDNKLREAYYERD